MLTFSGQDDNYIYIIHMKAKKLVIGLINFLKESRKDVIFFSRRLRVYFRIKIMTWIFNLDAWRKHDIQEMWKYWQR